MFYSFTRLPLKSFLRYLFYWFTPAKVPEPVPVPSFILHDGKFEDWHGIEPAVTDSPNDASPNMLDLSSLWITDDADYLFFRLELEQEILLQVSNGLTLYLDLDDDPKTGQPVHDIGVELAFTFGERRGWFVTETDTIEYETLGLNIAPTTMGKAFEISLEWNASPELKQFQFGAKPFRLCIADKTGGDVLPSVRYIPKKQTRPPLPTIDFEKEDSSHFRLVTHNVNRRHFHEDKRDAFTRVYRALQPNMLLLQEAYAGTAEEILDYFRLALGESISGQWHAYKAGEEATVLMSPFPASKVVPLGKSAAYLMDLRPFYPTELALIVLSMPCCRQDSARQEEADQIMAFIQDLRSPGGEINIPENTPILLAGDANLVGTVQQQQTLIHGTIQNTAVYGSSFIFFVQFFPKTKSATTGKCLYVFSASSSFKLCRFKTS